MPRPVAATFLKRDHQNYDYQSEVRSYIITSSLSHFDITTTNTLYQLIQNGASSSEVLPLLQEVRDLDIFPT